MCAEEELNAEIKSMYCLSLKDAKASMWLTTIFFKSKSKNAKYLSIEYCVLFYQKFVSLFSGQFSKHQAPLDQDNAHLILAEAVINSSSTGNVSYLPSFLQD